METRTQKDEAWCAVLDEMEAWAMLRRQPDCPRETQIHLDDLLSQAPLIRAAPDLVAALKALYSAAVQARFGDWRVTDQARAALAKVEA